MELFYQEDTYTVGDKKHTMFYSQDQVLPGPSGQVHYQEYAPDITNGFF